jgi:hypothetical protein
MSQNTPERHEVRILISDEMYEFFVLATGKKAPGDALRAYIDKHIATESKASMSDERVIRWNQRRHADGLIAYYSERMRIDYANSPEIKKAMAESLAYL